MYNQRDLKRKMTAPPRGKNGATVARKKLPLVGRNPEQTQTSEWTVLCVGPVGVSRKYKTIERE